MEALCLDVLSPWQLPPVPLMEAFEPVSKSAMIAEYTSMAGSDRISVADDFGPAQTSFHALASKKPRARSSAPRPKKGKTPPTRTRRGAVLIVDDMPDVTEMIGLLLKHAGYDVATAGSAKAALQLARGRHFDLVISDIGMPEMNGYELASALRHLAAYHDTPLIAVTGYSEYDDRGRAVEAGFNVHLAKPIEPAQLLNLMSELLSQSEPGTNQ